MTNIERILRGLSRLDVDHDINRSLLEAASELLRSQAAQIIDLESKLLLLIHTRPKTAPQLTGEDITEIEESIVRQTGTMIKSLTDHTSSTMISLVEIVCDRMVEISVEYCPLDDDSEDTP